MPEFFRAAQAHVAVHGTHHVALSFSQMFHNGTLWYVGLAVLLFCLPSMLRSGNRTSS